MLTLFKTSNPCGKSASRACSAVLNHVRRAEFYTDLKVPDTFEGRFELLTLHLFMLMEAVQDKDFSQALFDEMFRHIDQSLRERGIGDMGVPKRMRRMMRGFNGRVHAYKQGLSDQERLEQALARNLYGGVENISREVILSMKTYMLEWLQYLGALEPEKIKQGCFEFLDPDLN